jgi:glycosyltransferase involved in cell wall biosynthesis
MKKIHLVLVTAWPPTRFHAGGQRQLDIYTYLKKTGAFELSLYSRDIAAISNQIDRNELSQIFDNVYWAKSEILSGEELNVLSGCKLFDTLDLQHSESARKVNSFKPCTRKLIYTPMESEIRNLLINLKNRKFSKSSLKLAFQELVAIKNSDVITPVSSADENYVKMFAPRKTFHINTPLPVDFLDAFSNMKEIEFEEKSGVIFVAYFGSQTNIDSLDWYIKNVHSELMQRIPEMNLTVIGDKSDDLRERYSDQSIDFLGRVEELPPHVAKAKVAIAPSLYGSGFRGKINQYSIMNIPTVAHKLSVSSLNYPAGSIMVCETPTDWINAVSMLFLSKEKNLGMATLAKAHASTFSLSNQKEAMSLVYGEF